MTVKNLPVSMFRLSANGTHFVNVETALAARERVRAVDVGHDDPEKLKDVSRIMRLDLRSGPIPEWLKTARHLRVLKISDPGLKEVPKWVFSLPRLRELYVEGTGITHLNGIESALNLAVVWFRNTPLVEDNNAIAAIMEQTGATRPFGGMLRWGREPQAVHLDGAELAAALNDDRIDDSADLQNKNLEGAVLEDCVLNQNFQGANLRDTIWRRCDFDGCEFEGADLTGATFENCHISAQFEERIKAPNTVFDGCALSLDWPKADITNARFIDIESSPDLDFHGGTADGIQLAFAVASESSVKLNLKHASIKGASIQISLNADRRHALEANPNPKLKWMKGMFDEAVVDDATSIQLEPLPGVPEKKSQRKTKGKTKKSQYAVEVLGELAASNAVLWFLAVDSQDASEWHGSTTQDFDRAMDQDEGEISVGESSGVLAGVGDCGWSYVYRFQDIIAIPELYQSGHVASLGESFVHELGQRVASALVRVPNATYLGSLEIRSNLMQLLVPYVDGSVVEEGDDARIEIPCESGVWAVWTAPIYLEDQSREDELGRYGNIVFLRRE